MNTHFSLNHQLDEDSDFITDLTLSRVLLAKDGRFPWLILVPRSQGLTEIMDLSSVDQTQLLTEITLCSQFLKQHLAADKLNVAALGNIVTQLHIHVIARYYSDPAWPGPIWGQGSPIERLDIERDHLIRECQLYLAAETAA